MIVLIKYSQKGNKMSDNWLDEYKEGLFSGRIPMRNPNIKKPGDPEYYYYDPRGVDKSTPLKDRKLIGVPTADTPNPALVEMNTQREQERKYSGNLSDNVHMPMDKMGKLDAENQFTLNNLAEEKNAFSEINPVLDKNLVIKASGYDNYLSEKERQDAFRTGKKIRLKLEPNSARQNVWSLLYDHQKGRKTVLENTPFIEKYAQKYGVDPNLIKAVMYAENAEGDPGGFNRLSDKLEQMPIIGNKYKNFKENRLNRISSHWPMNIQGKTWANIDNRQFNSYDPEQNIEMATILLKRITDSLDKPLPSNIGSLYNGNRVDQVNKVGFRVGDAYNKKLWEKEEVPDRSFFQKWE